VSSTFPCSETSDIPEVRNGVGRIGVRKQRKQNVNKIGTRELRVVGDHRVNGSE
jgi:hypothetical protein